MDKYYDTKNGYQKNTYQYRNNPGLEDSPGYGNTHKNNNYNRREIKRITNRDINETFNLFAVDRTFLNRKGFDDALENLFRNIPIPELHHTYLSRKLYSIFNTKGDSKLFKEEFCRCIKQILSNKNNRLHLSMMATMSIPNKTRKYIDLDDIKKFFYESFVEGYKHLAWQINQNKEEFKNKNLPIVSISQLEAWARGFEKKIKNGFEKDLKMFDPNIVDNISFEQYVKWLHKDQNLYIGYGPKKLIIATSLIDFDNVQYEEI